MPIDLKIKVKYKKGNIYTGKLKDLKCDGQGTLTLKDGSKYVGSWENGFRHGHGIEYDPDGNIIYDGEWEDGLRKE